MTYEVWYRAGASLHWWKSQWIFTKEQTGDAQMVASAIEAALKQVGFLFAQAEVRPVLPSKESVLASLGYDPYAAE